MKYEWRGTFDNVEMNALHAEAFRTRVYSPAEWDWVLQVERHSLGWVTARAGDELAGFANVVWDGLVHAWLQDVMVADRARHRGVGTALVEHARLNTAEAGCEYLHVDFDGELAPFYFDACGFRPTRAGIIELG